MPNCCDPKVSSLIFWLTEEILCGDLAFEFNNLLFQDLRLNPCLFILVTWHRCDHGKMAAGRESGVPGP